MKTRINSTAISTMVGRLGLTLLLGTIVFSCTRNATDQNSENQVEPRTDTMSGAVVDPPEVESMETVEDGQTMTGIEAGENVQVAPDADNQKAASQNAVKQGDKSFVTSKCPPGYKKLDETSEENRIDASATSDTPSQNEHASNNAMNSGNQVHGNVPGCTPILSKTANKANDRG